MFGRKKIKSLEMQNQFLIKELNNQYRNWSNIADELFYYKQLCEQLQKENKILEIRSKRIVKGE